MSKARNVHREICSLCYEVNRVGFKVSDEIWALVVHRSQINDIICLQCFTRLADERGVQWDKKIKFYPVSFITNQTYYFINAGLLEAWEIGLSYIQAIESGVPRPILDIQEDKEKIKAAIAKYKKG